MIKLFRLISYLEGISYLLLLFVGVPLKYLAANDSWVKALGMPHGVLFILYIFLAIVMRQKLNWGFKTYATVLVAAVIPFGTFYTDKKFLSNINSQ